MRGYVRPSTAAPSASFPSFHRINLLTRISSPCVAWRCRRVERAMGIEPTAQAWEAWVLPLYDARFGSILVGLRGAGKWMRNQSRARPNRGNSLLVHPFPAEHGPLDLDVEPPSAGPSADPPREPRDRPACQSRWIPCRAPRTTHRPHREWRIAAPRQRDALSCAPDVPGRISPRGHGVEPEHR